MSMAKPIIVGAQGVVGFREQVISNGPDQNGVHINGGNPADIAWGIKETLADPERAKKWGQNGRKRVLQYFTWEEAARQTLQIYEMVQHPQREAEVRVVDLEEKLTRRQG
jgi:glycosyltransferase involved in cell wall biosynthesis